MYPQKTLNSQCICFKIHQTLRHYCSFNVKYTIGARAYTHEIGSL